MKRGVLVAIGLALACGVAAPQTRADPSIWARARQPALEARRKLLADVRRLRAEADAAAAGFERERRFDTDQAASLRKVYLRDARQRLEKARAIESRDIELLFEYADIVQDLGEHAAAVVAWKALLALDPPPAMASEIHPQLAVAYAQLEQSRLEIAAYDEALKLEPHTVQRARMLANRAEAFMTLGDLTSALEGYRTALASLANHEMPQYGVTTLWGLAVASDRSGDLDEALRAIKLARTYDPHDGRINGSDWFYVIQYDKHWYQALGHWSHARHAELAATRAEHYGRAIASWEAYVAAATPSEPWLPIARARLIQCQKEREASASRGKGAKAAPPTGKKPKRSRP